MPRVIHYTINEKPDNHKGKQIWLQESGYCGDRGLSEDLVTSKHLLATKTERRITCLNCLNKIVQCGVKV